MSLKYQNEVYVLDVTKISTGNQTMLELFCEILEGPENKESKITPIKRISNKENEEEEEKEGTELKITLKMKNNEKEEGKDELSSETSIYISSLIFNLHRNKPRKTTTFVQTSKDSPICSRIP